MLLLLSSLAFGQEINSLLPILTIQSELLQIIENEQWVVTDMSVGMVFDGTQGHSVPVELMRGDTVMFVGLGDEVRISDLDLYVFDASGTMLAEEGETDATPVLEFTAPADGDYDLCWGFGGFEGDVTVSVDSLECGSAPGECSMPGCFGYFLGAGDIVTIQAESDFCGQIGFQIMGPR